MAELSRSLNQWRKISTSSQTAPLSCLTVKRTLAVVAHEHDKPFNWFEAKVYSSPKWIGVNHTVRHAKPLI